MFISYIININNKRFYLIHPNIEAGIKLSCSIENMMNFMKKSNL